MGAEELAGALTRLRDAFGGLRLPCELPGPQAVIAESCSAAAQLDDYILPRLGRLEAPLLAVVGGPTGVGKSTLVNAVIGKVVSEAGVIRPTTRAPVLVHHPGDADWFTGDRILPGLARADAATINSTALQAVPLPTLPPGLAVLDTPDIDSVVAENRRLASQLLAVADLWLFVTSAARYADAVPWDYLRAAASRQVGVAVVLDRVSPAAMDEVQAHLGQMMSQRGLESCSLFVVPETEIDANGLLPNAAVAQIRSWLVDLALTAAARQAVVMRTLDKAIAKLLDLAPRLATAGETLCGSEECSEAAAGLRAAAATVEPLWRNVMRAGFADMEPK